jgi:hypothetical protein
MRFILNRKSEFIIYQFIINDTIVYPLGGEIWNKNTGPDFKQKQ